MKLPLNLPIACLTLLTISACSSSNGAPAGYAFAKAPVEFAGTWKSDGYGWIADFNATNFQVFDYTSAACIANADLSGLIDDFPAIVLVHEDGQRLAVVLEDPSYGYKLNRLDTLPASCGAPAAMSQLEIFDAFDAIFRKHYAFFDERQVDWPSLTAQARDTINTTPLTETQFFDLLGGLVDQIDDGHVSLQGTVNGEKKSYRPGRGKTGRALADQANRKGITPSEMTTQWRKSIQGGIDNDLLKGKGTVTGNTWIRYGLLEGDVGYLSIMAETFYSQEEDADNNEIIDGIMDDVIAEFKNAKGIILDISLNHGGEDTVSRRIAQRFATQEIRAYSKFPADGQDNNPQHLDLKYDPKQSRYTGPVYVLTSDHTVSAGEILTMSMRALPNVTHVGETTRGALSDVLDKPLPNGWTVTLSNEVYLDAEGEKWEALGIPPEKTILVFSGADPFKGHLDAVRAVQELMK